MLFPDLFSEQALRQVLVCTGASLIGEPALWRVREGERKSVSDPDQDGSAVPMGWTEHSLWKVPKVGSG